MDVLPICFLSLVGMCLVELIVIDVCVCVCTFSLLTVYHVLHLLRNKLYIVDYRLKDVFGSHDLFKYLEIN